VNSCLNIFSSVDCFDLLYLPLDIDRGCNRGYAFVNFKSAELARTFFVLFQSTGHISIPPPIRCCDVVFARIQGKEATLRNLGDSNPNSSRDVNSGRLAQHS